MLSLYIASRVKKRKKKGMTTKGFEPSTSAHTSNAHPMTAVVGTGEG
nr:hypothetical protein [Sicyoidochytrium minutum DNA virus]